MDVDYWNKILAEERVIDNIHQEWQDKIDKGFNAYIMTVTASYIHADNGVSGTWTQRYLLPFEKEKMQTEIREWEELY